MILETERLLLKKIAVQDAAFYFELFNDPDWIQYINDKGLQSVEQTKEYLEKEFIPKFCVDGLGFFTVFDKQTNKPIGASCILKREKLDFFDIGYGFLPVGRGKGLATEAAKRIIKYAKENLKQKRVLAITKPNNENSQRLLLKLGFTFLGNQNILFDNDCVFGLDI